MKTLSIGTTPVALDMTGIGPTQKVAWTLEGADVRVRFDGGAPTGTTGHLIAAGAVGQEGLWTFEMANAMRLVRAATATADAVLTYTPVIDGRGGKD
ncbi:MAG: hypothetical protein D6781_09160 [Verrucomicrobia bacterium]|nr:MAG: hypothetical protein D6781_09160 [Verrucomicrobiota bacterium]